MVFASCCHCAFAGSGRLVDGEVRRMTAPRYAEGVDGPILIAAYCPTCRCEAMPMRDGTCGWCDRQLIGDDDRPPPAPKKPPVKRRPHITADDIVVELQTYAAQLGRAPYSNEWFVSGRKPSRKTIYRRFGSWDSALVAAGLKEMA